MFRRDVLKSIATTAAAIGVLAAGRSAPAASAPRTHQSESALHAPYLEMKDRTRLFYKEWGSGKPVVFVHAWALSSQMWQYQMIRLAAQGVRCLAYDRRGHGRSSDPGRGFDFDTLADDLATVLAQLDLRDVTLIGHSMGTGEIVRYLTRHGSARIARIALLAPTTPYLLKSADNPAGVDAKFLDSLRTKWQQDFMQWAADNSRPFVLPDTSPETIQWGLRIMQQCSLKAAIDCHRALTETDFRSELKNVSVPTLIIQGDADVSAPIELTGKRTAALIPHSRLKVYPGAPHGLFVTHIEQLHHDLIEFSQA